MSSWSVDPLLVWGLFPRGLGLILFISFLSLSAQVVNAAGRGGGIGSVARRFAKMREDFPTWRRFFYFPTLLWISDSEAMLRALTWVGLACALCVIYGGPIGFWALLIAYVCYLSLDSAMALIFPWDCLLFESMLLGLFLPPTHALPDLHALHAPAPALTWAYRLLVFRVMFGFGKQKFFGSRSKDLAYLKGFLINQPLLSPVGWYAQKLPVGLLKIGVMFMFLAEIPVPFFAFFPGPLSVICAASTAFLMVGIQLMGSFGYFSLMTICACLPLLDNITPRELDIASLFAAGQPIFTNVFVLVHSFGALVAFPFSSWIGQSWTLWSLWYRLPRWVQPMFGFFRLLHPFRWLHPYGVFPPNNQPGVKISLLLEVSWDKQRWHEMSFEYAASNEYSRPRFVSPHHPRGDQAVIYDTFGLNPTSLISGMLGAWDPYFFAARMPSLAFCQSVLESKESRLAHTDAQRDHDTPPIAARITTIMLEPVTIAEHRKSGKYWKRTYIGPHVPTHDADPHFWDDVFGEAEFWHWESIMWRRRSRLRELMERARAGREDPLALAIWDGRLTAQDVERFWGEFVPLATASDRTTFDSLPQLVATLNERYPRALQRDFQRLLARFSLMLVARLEPLYFYRGSKPLIPARTYFHLWMLAQHVIAQGRDAFLEAFASSEACKRQLAEMTNVSGLYLMALCRFDEITFEAQKLRLIAAYVHPHDPQEKRAMLAKLRVENMDSLQGAERLFARIAATASGFFCVAPTIRESFIGPAFDRGFPELYPEFEELDSGELRVKAYRYPAPGVPLAPDLKSLPVPDPKAAPAAAMEREAQARVPQ